MGKGRDINVVCTRGVLDKLSVAYVNVYAVPGNALAVTYGWPHPTLDAADANMERVDPKALYRLRVYRSRTFCAYESGKEREQRLLMTNRKRPLPVDGNEDW